MTLMTRALALARRGKSNTAPNPMVGAVIARDGRIVGKGWHRVYGGHHGEVEAIKDAGKLAVGATMYVTLEPCNHYGKTGPCSKAIVDAGIAKVVIASLDPNPNVSGGGVAALKDAGVEVECGLNDREAKLINFAWLHWLETSEPFVLLKLAISANGKLAFPKGEQRWISSTVARAQVQRLRSYFNAVLVGVGTVVADDPLLTNRSGSGRQPLRVIMDSKLSLPLEAKVTSDQNSLLGAKTLLATTDKAALSRKGEFEKRGAEVLTFPSYDGKVGFGPLLKELGKRGIQSILCEGGAVIASEMLRQKICHAVLLYKSPEFSSEDEQLPRLSETELELLQTNFRLASVKKLKGNESAELYVERSLSLNL